MKEISFKNIKKDKFIYKVALLLLGWIHHYNHNKYWKMRQEVINPNSKKSIITRLWYLYRIKRSDAFNNATMGTDLNSGAIFATPPNLPHYLNGIFISHYAIIGKNCTIYQQVTISQGPNNEPTIIGDNVVIGAGAKIIGSVKIGDNVKIGANAVVVDDIPSNSIAVGVPARVISREKKKK